MNILSSYLNCSTIENWKTRKRTNTLKGSRRMGGGQIFLKSLCDTSFNKDLSNEPNFGRNHLAVQYLQNPEQFPLKGPTGQIRPAREWYHWIGIPCYRLLIYFIMTCFLDGIQNCMYSASRTNLSIALEVDRCQAEAMLILFRVRLSKAQGSITAL